MTASFPAFAICIDKVTVGAGLRVEGWAFHRRHGHCRVEASAGGAPPAPADRFRGGIDRHDVGLALGTPLADRSGFDLVAALPHGAASVSLVLNAGGERHVHPLLVREGASERDWRPAMDSGIAVMEHRFLTDRGPAYATALPPGFARAAEALGLFAAAPRPVAPLGAPVSIIVPIHGGKPFLTPLVRTLVETVEPRHRIILVDDASPDRAIAAHLVALATALDHVSVVLKPCNEGYPRAVAAGMEVADRVNPNGHVVLLNTDVEVPPGWLERLVGPLQRMPWIASATPLTNAGTICGFPAMPMDNEPFLAAAVTEIDAAFAALAEVPPVDLPTGVGFCMALNRRALRTIGGFDLEAFGRGYGEEVDWCRRAQRHGFVNVAVPNLYVHHHHGGSFPTEEKERRIRASGATISARYPEFDAEVQDFIRADPLRPLRAAAVAVVLGRIGRPRAVLLLDHAGGGGGALFRSREVARLKAAGNAVVLVRPARVPVPGMPEAPLDIELLHGPVAVRFPANALSDLAALVRELPLAEIVVNSLVGHPDGVAIMAFLRALRAERGVPLRLYHHDYFPVCPSLNLIGADDRYCGVPAAERCRACAAVNPHMRRPEGAVTAPAPDLDAHRRGWQALFDAADRHVVFSRASLAVLRRAFAIDDARVRVLPHLAEHVEVRPLPPPPPPVPVARVAIVGGIGVAKGSRVLEAMVGLAAAHRLPLVFELFGNIDRPLRSPHIHDNGGYEPERLAGMLAARGCHAVFVPSVWPETHCYVVDEVVGLGLPVGAFDIGAPAERLRHWPNGFVVAPIAAEAALTALLRAVGMAAGPR